jgi:hypothetical protein
MKGRAMNYEDFGRLLLRKRPDQFKALGATGTVTHPEIQGANQITYYCADDQNQHTLWKKGDAYFLHGFDEGKIVAVSELEAMRDFVEWCAPHELVPSLHRALDALLQIAELTTGQAVWPPRGKSK